VDRFKKNTRKVDGIYRYGGEEFILLFSGADSEKALRASNHLRDKIVESKFNIGKGSLDVRFSGGISVVRDGDLVSDTFERADVAMYKAKGAGKDRVVLYED